MRPTLSAYLRLSSSSLTDQNRLGPSRALSHLFRLFDIDQNHFLEPSEFFSLLGFLKKGDGKERAKALLLAYDDDESGSLEFSEADVLYDQLFRFAVNDGMAKKQARGLIATFREVLLEFSHAQKLDPEHSGIITESSFLQLAEADPRFLNYLIPNTDFEFDALARDSTLR